MDTKISTTYPESGCSRLFRKNIAKDITRYAWLVSTLLILTPRSTVAYYHLLICLIGSYSLLIIALFTKLFSAQTSAEKVFGRAHFAGSFEIKRAGLFNRDGIILGKAYGKLLRLSGFESVLITAPTGSGKTISIAVPNLIEWQGSVVVNDLKGELYRLTSKYREEQLGNKCFIWAPCDEAKKTHKYNPFFYVSKNHELRHEFRTFIQHNLKP
jgi:type IV secretion system protein VirD4